MHRRPGLAGSALSLLLLAAAPTAAHESRPIHIELVEMAESTFQLQWKLPASLPDPLTPDVIMPAGCEALGPVAEILTPGGLVRRGSYACSMELSGQQLKIAYPGPNPSISSLVRYRTLAGQQHTALLAPDESVWVIPETESAPRVARQYLLLGLHHILGGIDHLLFLACLLWIAGTGRRIVITVTGFTLAHSITLAASALQAVRLPVPPVEAVIALSIVFVAAEIAKGRRDSLTWRFPVAVSSSFGLLHGFGFAAALNEVGLPQTELLTGLLFFNLGVEAGQLAFVAAVVALATLAGRAGFVPSALTRSAARLVTSYTAGSVAAFWLFQRCSAF